MKKNFIILILVLALIGSLVYIFINKEDNKKSESQETVSTSIEESSKREESDDEEEAKSMTDEIMNENMRRVMATKLNIRKEPGLDNEPIGTAGMNTVVKLINKESEDWALVEVELSNLNRRDEEGTAIFSNSEGEDLYFIKSENLDAEGNFVSGNQYYMNTQYLTQDDKYEYTDMSNAKNPFNYGLLFYDENVAKVMETEIWNNMKDELKDKGYDGVKVVPCARDKIEDMVASGELDAVECAPSDFVNMNSEEKQMEAFGKTMNKVTEKSTYSGIIIANKDSGVDRIEDIVGKKIVTCMPYSDSGNQIQKYYLKNNKDIDIVKESGDNLEENTRYHHDVFFKVALGQADVGFCGDFILTDPYTRFEKSAKTFNVPMNSKEDLDKLKSNVQYFELKGINEIPNNPHALRAELYEDKKFRNSLKDVVEDTYNTYREDFGLVDAYSEEYDFLNEIHE